MTPHLPKQGRNRKNRDEQRARQPGDRPKIAIAKTQMKAHAATSVYFAVEQVGKLTNLPVAIVASYIQAGTLTSVKVNGRDLVTLRQLTQFLSFLKESESGSKT